MAEALHLRSLTIRPTPNAGRLKVLFT